MVKTSSISLFKGQRHVTNLYGNYNQHLVTPWVAGGNKYSSQRNSIVNTSSPSLLTGWDKSMLQNSTVYTASISLLRGQALTPSSLLPCHYFSFIPERPPFLRIECLMIQAKYVPCSSPTSALIELTRRCLPTSPRRCHNSKSLE